MTKIHYFVLSALLVACSSLSHAATVELDLDLSVPGQFSLRASEIDGDNFGIASLGVALGGGVTNIVNELPWTIFAQDGGFVGGPAGFSSLRSGDGGNAPANNPLFATQNTVDPTPHLIYGFGQQASSFAGEGLNAVGGTPKGDSWDAAILVATGTWEGEEPRIDLASVQTFSNVFTDAGSAATRSAEVVLPPVGPGGLTGMYVGPGGSLSEGLQGAFQNRNGGPIVLENAIMLSNTDPTKTLADLDPINGNIVLGMGGSVATASLIPGDPGKYGIMIEADFPNLPPDTMIQGEALFTTGAAGANPNAVGFGFTVKVPEPSTVALSGLALVGLVGLARRRG